MKRRSWGISRRRFLGFAGVFGLGALGGLHFCRGPDHERLVRLWRRRLELEEDSFERLRFTLSPTQLRSGKTLKLVLRDQFGDDWLFKMGDVAIDGAEAVYRIGCLFGWETPELHRITLPINDQMVFGSVQRLIPDAEDLGAHVIGPTADLRRFSDSALEYLLTAQLLWWVTANHHVHTEQFIATRKSDSIDRVHRIDNTVEWFLVGHDTLGADYVTPLLAFKKSRLKLGYNWLWRRFRESVIDLPLTKTHALACFIADLPDEVFVENFLPGIDNDFRSFPNADGPMLTRVTHKIVPEGEKELFLKRLVARKHRLPEDTERLFDEQLAVRGVERDYRDGPSPRAIGEQLCAYLETRIEELEQRSAEQPPEPSPPQKTIQAITSFAAYSVLLSAFRPGSVSHVQMQLFRATVGELESLRAATSSRHERAAVDIAIDTIRGELAAPRSPNECLSLVSRLNELFPVLPDSSR